MKTARDKYVVVGADFAGFPLKEAVKRHLVERGWTVEDLTPTVEQCDMYHRVGFLVGSKISEDATTVPADQPPAMSTRSTGRS